MAIKMNTYAGNQIAPEYDGMLYDMIFGQSGVISGCELSFMGANQVHIGKGYILIKGRFCTVLEETLLVEMSGSESELPGRIYIHADLTDSQEPVKFMSVTGNPLPELNQDEDFNYNDGMYEIELGTYTAGSTSISNLVTTFEEIDGTGGIKKLIGNLSNLKTESKDTIVSAINEQNVKIESFENTKSEIVGSGLGTALSLTASTTWANIVSKIKGVITKLSGSTAIAADKMGWDPANNYFWCYIPANAFYSTSHWLRFYKDDVAAKIGLTAAKIVTGNTILGIAGTNKGYDAGYAAGQAAPVYKTGSFQSGYSNGDTVTINVGFKPSVVIIKANDASCLAACDSRTGINHVMAVGNNTPGTISITSSGFVFTSITNFANRSCKYIAYK